METLHPLVSVIDLSKAKLMKHMRHTFSFYVVFLKDEKNCELVYGRNHYDYQKGSVVCLAPGQVIGVKDTGETFQPQGWVLCFEPELIRGTSLGRNIREAMCCIRQRLKDKEHLFREELMGNLLTAHILDLYDIHARSQNNVQVSERITVLLRKFIELLYNGEYIQNRDLNFYASQLCITPHYLSEICKKVSGKPATYWIDRFTPQDITRLLRQKELSLTTIAERMNFSSVSYFSRYVQKRMKITPSEYKKDVSVRLIKKF